MALSGIPSPCCLTGTLSTRTPSGQYTSVGNVDAYIAKPGEASKAAVVICTDIFGYKVPNVQLIADSFAEAGILAVVPDYFQGTALPLWVMERAFGVLGIGKPRSNNTLDSLLRLPGNTVRMASLIPSLLAFVARHRDMRTKVPVVRAVLEDLRASHGVERVGVVGYCYGGGPCLSLAVEPNVVDAFVVAHTEISWERVQALVTPGLIICADKDFTCPEKVRTEIESRLAEQQPPLDCHLRFFPGTYHGFAVRGDEGKPEVQKAKEEALALTLGFMKERLVAG